MSFGSPKSALAPAGCCGAGGPRQDSPSKNIAGPLRTLSIYLRRSINERKREARMCRLVGAFAKGAMGRNIDRQDVAQIRSPWEQQRWRIHNVPLRRRDLLTGCMGVALLPLLPARPALAQTANADEQFFKRQPANYRLIFARRFGPLCAPSRARDRKIFIDGVVTSKRFSLGPYVKHHGNLIRSDPRRIRSRACRTHNYQRA